MVKHPREGFGDLRSLDMMQLVNDYHDYSLVEMGFNVWYRLSEYLYQCEEAEFEEIRNIFSPYVEKLVGAQGTQFD
jgi:transportin-3